MKRAIFGAAVAALQCAPTNAQTDDRPVAFEEHVGDWTVLGDPSLSACVAMRPEQSGTTLTIALLAAGETVRFALSNPAWRSLEHGPLRIGTTFHTGGKITDFWDLDAFATSASDEGGPRIHFDIWRAKNDGASFVEQFRKASSIRFWRGTVPVADFDLTGSSRAMEVLLHCRAIMRADESFDPFAD